MKFTKVNNYEPTRRRRRPKKGRQAAGYGWTAVERHCPKAATGETRIPRVRHELKLVTPLIPARRDPVAARRFKPAKPYRKLWSKRAKRWHHTAPIDRIIDWIRRRSER